jgi:hypothetical protein
MKPTHIIFGLYAVGLAAAVLFLSHYGFGWVAAMLISLPIVATWWRSGRGRDAALAAIPPIIIELSIIGLISLTNEPNGQLVFPALSQLILSVLLAAWIAWWHYFARGPKSAYIALGLSQFSATSAIFLAAAFWHWPAVVVLITMWVSSYVIALWYMSLRGESAAHLLAATWALIVAEASWVFNIWLVNYVLGGGYVIVPQAAVVILGLGYCYLSIYLAHVQKTLSRRRLVEYIVIIGILLAIVVAGTRWNGAV